MIKVYLLEHSYAYGVASEHDETKAIGVFSSRSLAEKTIMKYKELPGFKEFSIGCFYISEYDLDQELWTEGFVEVKSTEIPSWAKEGTPKFLESGSDFANRLMNERYGSGNYKKGPDSEYNKLKKYGDKGGNV